MTIDNKIENPYKTPKTKSSLPSFNKLSDSFITGMFTGAILSAIPTNISALLTIYHIDDNNPIKPYLIIGGLSVQAISSIAFGTIMVNNTIKNHQYLIDNNL